jgi:hypothetical protein
VNLWKIVPVKTEETKVNMNGPYATKGTNRVPIALRSLDSHPFKDIAAEKSRKQLAECPDMKVDTWNS